MHGKVSEAGFRQAFHQGVRAAIVIVAESNYRRTQLATAVHRAGAVCVGPSYVLGCWREVLRQCDRNRQPVRILPFSQP
jgi:hypothetical protein